MAGGSGKVHVVRVSKTGYVDKQGRRRDYSSAYLRRTYRDGGKVKNETVANLSALPGHVIDLIDAGLKGQQLVPAGEAVTITGSLPHGHVAAVHAMAAKLGLPALLGPAGPHRDLAMALIISRVIRPGSKLSTLTWWADATLGADLGVADAATDDIYAAMDWLAGQQDSIEAGLAARHLAPAGQPGAAGAVRPVQLVDGRTALPAGRPRLLPGRQERETADRVRAADRPPGTPGRGPGLPRQHGRPRRVHRHRERGPDDVRPAGNGYGRRPRHDHQRPHRRPEPAGRRHRAAGHLRVDHRAARPGHPQADGRRRAAAAVSLFDEQDLAEITSPDFPGERLVACRNPVLAADRARTREDLLAATEKLLAPLLARVQAGKLTGAGPIGVEVGKVISTYKTSKHFAVTITDTTLAIERRQDRIDAEAALDGFYVLRTPIPADELDAAGVVTAYKNLKYVERDFRHIKSDDLDLRPVFHRLEERVRAHVLICMLACYLTWHLRRAWAPLTFTDENPPGQGNPVAPARRSATAQAKASGQYDPAGQPYHSFRGLIEHLATLTRNQVRFAGTRATVPMLTEPTSAQREAFRLIGVPIPLMLK